MNASYNDFSIIESLDFDAIKVKLIHKRSGESWTQERADAVEKEYRRFLYLMKKYPNDVTAPSIEVDRFWHQHILDTVKYARDCEAVFGYFLHHNPYLGLGLAGDDTAVWEGAGERMRELYEQTFGEPYQCIGTGFCTTPTQAFCTRSAQAFCTKSPQAFCTTSAQAFCTTSAQAFCTTSAQAFRTTSTQAFCTAPGLALRDTDQALPSEQTAAAKVENVAFCTTSVIGRPGVHGAHQRQAEPAC